MSDDKHCSAHKTFLDHCSDLRIRPGTTQVSIITLMRQGYSTHAYSKSTDDVAKVCLND